MMPPSGTRRLLAPLIPAYRLAVFVRDFRLRRGWEPVRRLKFPVISIGNLSTGGAGKTPFTIALARALAERGFTVDVLSRGYGRRNEATARVDPDGTVDNFGDEPLLIAREARVPVYVGRERYDAGLLAETEAPATSGQPRVHLLDDAFQHRQLHRDIDILLLNRGDWHDRLLPAGNLREPVPAFERADVIAIPGDDAELEAELRARGWSGKVWHLNRHMDVPGIEGPVVAFCGIARPEQFFQGLERAGVRLAARIVFRDHHRYERRDLERLWSAARTAGVAALVTTAKDRVRLEFLSPQAGFDVPIVTAGLRIEIQDEAGALDWLAGRLSDTAFRQSV
jgi:tetraacyldisaccharide 4'-kinase